MKKGIPSLGVLGRAWIAMAIVVLGCHPAPIPSIPIPPDDAQHKTFRAPMIATQRASVDALAEIGCVVNRQEGSYIEGARPAKSGLFLASGGEIVRIWFEERSPGETAVTIYTQRRPVAIGPFMYAGQKRWEADVLDSMTSALHQ